MGMSREEIVMSVQGMHNKIKLGFNFIDYKYKDDKFKLDSIYVKYHEKVDVSYIEVFEKEK